MRVEGNRTLPADPIVSAAFIKTGTPYSESKLKDAQEAIYGLGAFASVEIETQPHPDSDIVDVIVRVVPSRRLRLAIGAGIEAGARQGLQGDQTDNLPNWDLHLLARVEHRNFLGGMRRLRIEDRPRLIFTEPFPETGDGPKPGNLLMFEIDQPSFLEARTTLMLAEEWDYGPDPYGQKFFRHDLDTWIGPGRYFFRRALYLSSALHFNLFSPQGENPENCGGDKLRSYYSTFLEHSARLDLRDDARRTTRGSYYSLSFQHAGYFLPSDWDYLRFTPEMRGYIPLFWRWVLAGRAKLGMLIITDSDIKEDQELRDLGPYRYRLRGGGPGSVRGFDVNALGDARWYGDCLISGGVRQWEASLELRIPVTVDIGTVLFADAGDVTVEKRFRFNYPQTTLGFGLRWHTIVGPLRFDMGFLPKGLQVFGTDRRPNPGRQRSHFLGIDSLGWDGAWHLSIGEAF